MSLPHAILGVLEARPMTGYELTRFFESSANWVWSAPQSQIYPLLKRLADDGLVEGEEQTRGARLRRVQYSITPAGLEQLRAWLRVPVGDLTPRDPQLLQALFLDLITPGEADAVLTADIATLRERLEQWAAHRDRLMAKDTPLLRERLSGRDPADHDRIAALKAHVFDYLVTNARMRIEWAERTRDILAGIDLDRA